MNISSLLGIFMGIAVMYGALHASTDNMMFFLDPHGILIVVGGTAAAASISFSLKDVFTLFKIFVLRVLGHQRPNFAEVINQALEMNKRMGMGAAGLSDYIPNLKHEFLKEAITLVSQGILSEQEIKATLDQRIKTIEARYLFEANMFKTIGKFPPAFGLLATTLGMIGLLQKIGQPESQKLIGPAMSVGLIGTLYGITLANLVFLPIAENLTERTHEEIILRKMIVEVALLLKSQANPVTMREKLNSFVLPKHRVRKRTAA